MSEEAQVKSVALFYFFSLLDENLAKQATIKTILKVQNRIKKNSLVESQVTASIVYCTNKIWEKFKTIKSKGHNSISYEAGWLLPKGINIGLWQDFLKAAEDDEFLAVLWSRVLKFSDEDISQGLGVTEGTVRHRVSRGLRLLGKLSQTKD